MSVASVSKRGPELRWQQGKAEVHTRGKCHAVLWREHMRNTWGDMEGTCEELTSLDGDYGKQNWMVSEGKIWDPLKKKLNTLEKALASLETT